jgi:IS5 family transposase
VYADKAYDDAERRAVLRCKGIQPRILHKARANKPLTFRQFHEHRRWRACARRRRRSSRHDELESRAAGGGEPAAAGLHGAAPQPGVGRRHHLHRH